ncbi:hypothetical protein LL037_25465 (plasmid) [Clostridium estertheticum]|uniref:Uncharacterized protein n=1 Tax=Clostridium estertheticum TaxID=238834 RepID=A0AA47EN27_9CLOT|nr:hypothetical protein [Clostridium estertheticum]MBU3201780.1 hypothetical protein [Clostridium estertheticum]WAG63269.1 hypothetical protein LL038_24905 [Clostridium estertheticum]WAG68175.1 hypothetical protein LL037_25465 [Clostridium estertheticum]
MKNINTYKKISIICYGFSVLIFFIIYLLGIFSPPGYEIGYFLFFFYTIMPITTLVSSLIISIKKGYLFWLYPVFVGLLGILIPFLLTKSFEWMGSFFAFFPALIGLVLGLIISFIIKKYKTK